MSNDKYENPYVSIPLILERISKIETDISWLKQCIEKLDRRLWYLIVTIFINIVVFIIQDIL